MINRLTLVPIQVGIGCFLALSVGCTVETDLSEDIASYEEPLTAIATNVSALAWGSVSYVTCNSCWSCASSSSNPGAIFCSGKSKATCHDPDQVSSSGYWEPLFYCDNTCSNATSASYSDADRFVAMPSTSAGVSCGQIVTVCWNNRCSKATVRDLSDAAKWELNHGVMNALGAPVNSTISSGVSIHTGFPSAAPSSMYPSGSVSVSFPVTLQWGAVYPGTTYYQIDLKYSSGSGWVQLYGGFLNTAENANSMPGIGTNLPSGTGYSWRVRACNESGCGPWSTTAYFTHL
ncbi:uncharacterized protein SOCE836_011590 [Sorangium cellulosum]|uniref:Fibronectin type-III domain-containing protein n=1 Tax=Sorangium cellulosum TaxID=56 RepID=A0A4P2QIA0_SORCE|nr:uncharacterized protein SOCE836_011590 [Sorangium cellulosum]WCQ88463.1 hypothetical protein NQZ70_01140 [Sorangium sp. Soce836]